MYGVKPQVRMALARSVDGVVSFDETLKRHTTFRIGGRALVWIEPSTLDDLGRALAVVSKERLNPFLIGGGSNILASDGNISRAFIKLASPYFKKTEFGADFVICGAGCGLARLIEKSAEAGFGGVEGLAGIPGTIGGAIMMNAGRGRGESIGDIVEWVRVMNNKGKVSLLRKEQIKFSYRISGLDGYIILETRLKLKRKKPAAVKKRLIGILRRKQKTQDYRYPNAGSIFKNPGKTRFASGQLIDRCGLKGARINDAQISTKHANFIVNRGDASFNDVTTLMGFVQRTVKKNYGIWLEPEIKIVK